jgi:hypothetical protein
VGERRRYKICNTEVGIQNSSILIPINLTKSISVKNL